MQYYYTPTQYYYTPTQYYPPINISSYLCNGCNTYSLNPWKCNTCPDFHLCPFCVVHKQHNNTHNFIYQGLPTFQQILQQPQQNYSQSQQPQQVYYPTQALPQTLQTILPPLTTNVTQIVPNLEAPTFLMKKS